MLSCVCSLINIVFPSLKPKKTLVASESGPFISEYRFFNPRGYSILRVLSPAQKDDIPWVAEFSEEYGQYKEGTKQYECLAEILLTFSEELDRSEVDVRIASIIEIKRFLKANLPATPAWRPDELAYFKKYCIAHGHSPIPDDPDDTWNDKDYWLELIEDGAIEAIFERAEIESSASARKPQCNTPSSDIPTTNLFDKGREVSSNDDAHNLINDSSEATPVKPQIALDPTMKGHARRMARYSESLHMKFTPKYLSIKEELKRVFEDWKAFMEEFCNKRWRGGRRGEGEGKREWL